MPLAQARLERVYLLSGVRFRPSENLAHHLSDPFEIAPHEPTGDGERGPPHHEILERHDLLVQGDPRDLGDAVVAHLVQTFVVGPGVLVARDGFGGGAVAIEKRREPSSASWTRVRMRESVDSCTP